MATNVFKDINGVNVDDGLSKHDDDDGKKNCK